MFGSGYKWQNPIEQAAIGTHTVVIKKVYECRVQEYNVLRFEIVYENGEELSPTRFDVFDCPANADEKSYNAFCRKVSAIRACFDLNGEFTPSSYQRWVGKSGSVEIAKDSKGFLFVSKFNRRADFVPAEYANVPRINTSQTDVF